MSGIETTKKGKKMPNRTATWIVALNSQCPGCGDYVNLLDYDDFWDNHPRLTIPENNTENSRNMDVNCPNCNHEFIVDCDY
jgi:ribosomal protein S27E